jgi:hypothetical protein
MRAFLIPVLVFSLMSSALAADTDQTLYFAKSDKDETTTVKLVIKGSKVTGTHEWLPTEKDGAHGTITGTMKGDRVAFTAVRSLGSCVQALLLQSRGQSQGQQRSCETASEKRRTKDRREKLGSWRCS